MADDLGVQYTDAKVAALEKKLNKEYKQAQKDIKKKLDDFTAKSAAKEQVYLQKVANGEMTQDAFDKWKQGQVFYGENWKAQQESIAKVLANTNTVATNMINGEKADVFAFNGNYTAYQFEHGFGADFGFDLYSEKSVEHLLKDNPQILPKKKLDKSKDVAWNMRNIRSQITQGIIQGESIPKIAERLANVVPDRNKKQMVMHARTAMTAAQNSGRMERFKEAEKLGIKFKKLWIATLDNRTRDSHQDLDGETAKPDEPFELGKIKIMYPGDPKADPSEVYNCRCTLGTVLDDYPSSFDRRAKDVDGKYKQIGDMSYNDWYISKTANDPNAPLKDLQKLQKKLQTQMNKMDVHNHTFSGIWKNQTVTYADYEAKKGSIQGKKDYYNQQLDSLKAQGITSGTQYDFYNQKLKELEDFEKNGAKYAEYVSQLKDANGKVLALKPPDPNAAFPPEAYSQDRLDHAVWAKSARAADKELRGKTGEVWRNASWEEKDGIYEYTQSYHKYNEPLRGIEYGTNRYLGVGKTDLNAGYAQNGERLNAMTDILEKCSYDKDVWLQRGCQFGGMDKFFQCDPSLLQYGTEQQLQQELLGKSVTEYGFMSCGTSKGKGFSGDILLNVYAPKGTKMMYVEPFSRFSGSSDHINWDGISEQSSFGYELETILQQGTQFSVEKIERRGSQIYVDLYVRDQSHQQRWIP